MPFPKLDRNFAFFLGALAILLVFSLFFQEITGAFSYPLESRIIYRNPLATPAKDINTQLLSTGKLVTSQIASPTGESLSIASPTGVLFEPNTRITIAEFSGIGNAYICVNNKGTLYRNQLPCI